MPSRDRVVAVFTLALLNVFALGAALGVVKVTPGDALEWRPAAVAARTVLTDDDPGLPAVGSSAPLPNPTVLASRLSGLLHAPGATINGIVIDADTGRVLFDGNADAPSVPASTTKLTTTTAVLAAVGPDHRLTTKVVRTGTGVVLVGRGDPTLTTSSAEDAYPRWASLTDLAKQTAQALRSTGTTQVRVDYDASLYQGSRTAPGWKPNYVPEGDVAPVTALEVDEGRVAPGARSRVSDPPRTAAAAFVDLLGKYGVTGALGARVVAPEGARRIAAVHSPPVSVMVEHLLTVSDNDMAEAMARQVAIARHMPPTFQGAAKAIHRTLADLGVTKGVNTVDGSGLSHRNRITPRALAEIVALAASGEHPRLRSVVTGMPIAGFSGTLASRFGPGTTSAGQGVVRAKTGTLDGVNTLAGMTYDADGRLLVFAFMANNVTSPVVALNTLDRLATTLAGCGCR